MPNILGSWYWSACRSPFHEQQALATCVSPHAQKFEHQCCDICCCSHLQIQNRGYMIYQNREFVYAKPWILIGAQLWGIVNRFETMTNAVTWSARANAHASISKTYLDDSGPLETNTNSFTSLADANFDTSVFIQWPLLQHVPAAKCLADRTMHVTPGCFVSMSHCTGDLQRALTCMPATRMCMCVCAVMICIACVVRVVRVFIAA